MLECRQWCLHLHIVFHEYLSLPFICPLHSFTYICSFYDFLLVDFYLDAVKHFHLIVDGFATAAATLNVCVFLLFVLVYFVFECSLNFKWEKYHFWDMMIFVKKILHIIFTLSTLFQIFHKHIWCNNCNYADHD